MFGVGNKQSYLGMEIEVTKLLEGMEVKQFESPGTKDTFVVDECSKKLAENDRKDFHSRTANFLYLAKRARPDILTVAIRGS